MKLGELMSLMSCKNGKELFEKVEKILNNFYVTVYNADGSVKDFYEVCCDVAEVLNKEK